MLRKTIHAVIAYKKRVGKYTIKIERINGAWHTWVFGPPSSTNDRPVLLYGHDGYSRSFNDARKDGISFIQRCARENLQ